MKMNDTVTKELLERIAKCMPSGWTLTNFPLAEGSDLVGPDEFSVSMLYRHGDIGLAPLTALLKQDLVDRMGHLGSVSWGNSWKLVNKESDDRGPENAVMDYSGMAYAAGRKECVHSSGDTEFECVAEMYLKLKEPK